MMKQNFSNGRKRCDDCASDRGTFLAIRSDPVRWAKWLADKRERNAKQRKAKRDLEKQRLARFKLVEADPDEELPDDVKPLKYANVAPLWAKRYAAGESSMDIAKSENVTPGVVYQELIKQGVVLRNRSTAVSQAMVKWYASGPKKRVCRSRISVFDQDEIVSLYASGQSLKQISVTTGRMLVTIKKVLVSRGVRIRTAEEQWNLMFSKKPNDPIGLGPSEGGM